MTEYKGLVRYWLTFNEINCLLMGGFGGVMGGGMVPEATDTPMALATATGTIHRRASMPCTTSSWRAPSASPWAIRSIPRTRSAA